MSKQVIVKQSFSINILAKAGLLLFFVFWQESVNMLFALLLLQAFLLVYSEM